MSMELIKYTIIISFSLAFLIFILLYLMFLPLKNLTIYTNQIIDKKNKKIN